MEECIKYGGFVRGVPKKAVRPAAPEPAPVTAEDEMLQEVPGEPSRTAGR